MKRFGFVLATLGCMIFAAAASAQQTIKIGIILTYSGPNASLGEYVDKGLALYAKLHEKDLPAGTKIEIIRRDDTGPNPEVARRLAQELITRERVNFLGGVIFTPNGNAIAPLTAEAKVPFVIMNAAGTNTTVSSPYVTRTSFTL
ncbi:MAG TPA: ABC transporter substrate-binding protein, partial [Alphaproteobacteria bacterium]|nr:ABC transporter substrate-binding protein [Alphaproteobacteria bacterium]